jgi:hypothetical protein
VKTNYQPAFAQEIQHRCPLVIASFFFLIGLFHLSSQTGDDTDKYSALIKQHLYQDYKSMFRPPTGTLTHFFITPGGPYAKQLWDWDSWLCDIALDQILTDQKASGDKNDAITYGQGCVLNFLEAARNDGSIPILINSDKDSHADLPSPHEKTNRHKPVLAQHAAFLCKLNHDNADWLRQDFPKLEAFIQNYRDNSWNAPTGLYFWQNDLAIGVDNDPSTFFRPPGSSGSIYLNCLMYKELQSMAYLANCLGLPGETASKYLQQAADLKSAIQQNCWDERDGFYYSVDLNLRPITNIPGNYLGFHFVLHSGHPRDYSCLIQRIEGWSGFMAMWAGIASPQQAQRMVNERLKNPKTLGAAYGVRSLSKMEKMYGLYVSSNPSNWDGPIWGISNYMVFKGLVRYGFTEEARNMADKTIDLFGRDFEKTNTLHEYYNPDSGEPIANAGFQSWNYLVINMIAWRENRPVIQEF